MPLFVKKIDKALYQELPLLILLLLVIGLRLPNLFEPYWYGDEGIYLTIGAALRHGARLYVDIVDHKTPLIYYLAMVPSQFWFRVLNLGWMLVTTVAFYHIALRLLCRVWPAAVAGLIFVALTSLPWLMYCATGPSVVYIMGMWPATRSTMAGATPR